MGDKEQLGVGTYRSVRQANADCGIHTAEDAESAEDSGNSLNAECGVRNWNCTTENTEDTEEEGDRVTRGHGDAAAAQEGGDGRDGAAATTRMGGVDRKGSVERRIEKAKERWRWEPHPTQREWMLCEADVKVAACGRRWGKTEAAAYDAATYALEFPKSVQMIVSPTYDQSRLIFGTVERLFLDEDDLRAKTTLVRTPYPKLTYKNGSVIMARTADEDGRNLRGHRADRVIVDEAAYVRDAVVEEVISPMLADNNGRLILTSTPFGRNHFYRAFVRGQEGDGRYRSFRFPSWENPHISREYIESQREILTERQFAVEYEAQFLDDQNSVFRWADIEAAVAACPRVLGACAGDGCRVSGVGELDVPITQHPSPNTWLVAGVDWARYSDYTAVVVVDVSTSPYRVEAIDRFNLLSWQMQVERIAGLVEKLGVRSVLMDQTSIGDPLLEQTRSKLSEREVDVFIEGVTFTNQSKRELVDRLAILLSHRQLVIPNDEQLIKELQYYEYELTESGNMRMSAKKGYTDDLVCALALAVKAAKDAPGPLRVLTSGKRIWDE